MEGGDVVIAFTCRVVSAMPRRSGAALVQWCNSAVMQHGNSCAVAQLSKDSGLVEDLQHTQMQ